MTKDDAILTYWKSLTGMKKSEIENIKEELIKIANNVYYEHYFRDYPHITLEYYIREGELCEYLPLEVYNSKLDDDIKKKVTIQRVQKFTCEISKNTKKSKNLPVIFWVAE